MDATGYLKAKASGSYISDQNGNLFELNNNELNEAKLLGMI